MIELGAGFRPRVELVHVEEPPAPTVDDLRTEQLLAALAGLHEALASMPTPVVQVAEPDLTGIVQAVVGLKGSATADEIAAAVVREIGGDTRPAIEPVLQELAASLKNLDFRLKGVGSGSGGGGGGSNRVQNVVGTALDTQQAPLDSHYEWQQVAGQSVPLYIGTALPGTATDADGWRLEKYTYISGPAGDPVPALVQAATGAWDSRASLF